MLPGPAGVQPTPGMTANMPPPPPGAMPSPPPGGMPPPGAAPPPGAGMGGPPPGGMPPGGMPPPGPGGMPPPTAPMSDAPPPPLPANPRSSQPSPKTSGQAQQEANMLGLMEDKNQVGNGMGDLQAAHHRHPGREQQLHARHGRKQQLFHHVSYGYQFVVGAHCSGQSKSKSRSTTGSPCGRNGHHARSSAGYGQGELLGARRVPGGRAECALTDSCARN
jgi:hypothetical protein